MADSKAYQYYKGLPPWAKGVVGVGATAVVLIAIYKVYSGIKKAKSHANALQEADQASHDLSDVMKAGVSPTYPDSQYESWSNQLVAAFSGCGTDVPAINNVFTQLQNEADLLKLISTYGIRTYDRCLSFAYVLGGGKNTLSLSAALSDELGASDIELINNILAAKGIKYRF